MQFFSRLAPVAIVAAGLLPAVLAVKGGNTPSGFELSNCQEGDGGAKRWYSELEIPGSSNALGTQFNAYLKKKLANHDVVFSMNVLWDGAAEISIVNGHGDNQTYRVTYKNGNNQHLKSYIYVSNSGRCQTPELAVAVKNVKHVVVEMENRW